MQTVIVVHDYDVPPARLWNLVTDYAALAEVMSGFARFDGLPKGRTYTGQVVEVRTSLFGVLPSQPYRMEVVECDDVAMRLISSERGMGVTRWAHTLQVAPHGGGCRLTDAIEIEAGLATPIYAAWARFIYRARHKPRLRILSQPELKA